MKIHSVAVLIIGIIFLSLILGATKQSSTNVASASNKTELSDSQIPLQDLKSINISFVGNDLAVVENRIWPDIELKLKLAGIKVISDYEYKRDYEQGIHYPFIMLHTGLGSASFVSQNLDTKQQMIHIELHENVLLARDPNISFCTTTWTSNSLCLFLEKDRFEKLSETTLKLFTEFLNDYLSANPKEPNSQTNQQ